MNQGETIRPVAGGRSAASWAREVLYRGRELPPHEPGAIPLELIDRAWVEVGADSPWAWQRAAQVAVGALLSGAEPGAEEEARSLLATARGRVGRAPAGRLTGPASWIPGLAPLLLWLAAGPTRRVVALLGLTGCAMALVFGLAHRMGGDGVAGRGLPSRGPADIAAGMGQFSAISVVGTTGLAPDAGAAARPRAPAVRGRERQNAQASRGRALISPDDHAVVAAELSPVPPATAPQAVDHPPSAPRPPGGVDGLLASAGGQGAPVAGGLAYTALSDEAPMPFVGIEAEGASLWVSQTEVTEAQWLAVMGLDLSVLMGTIDRPARHLTLCDALRFANGVSEAEGFRPVYDVPRDCERGGEVRLRRNGDGFRLMSATEWAALRGPGPPVAALDDSSSVWDGGADPLGLFGLQGGIAELVWTPGDAAAVVVGCESSAEGTCAEALRGNEVDLEVGLRLVRATPAGGGASVR